MATYTCLPLLAIAAVIDIIRVNETVEIWDTTGKLLGKRGPGAVFGRWTGLRKCVIVVTRNFNLLQPPMIYTPLLFSSLYV